MEIKISDAVEENCLVFIVLVTGASMVGKCALPFIGSHLVL